MPYADPIKKRAWEKAHRSARSRAFLDIADLERAKRQDRKRLELAERMASPDERQEAVLEYEATFGLGNSTADASIMRALRRI